MSFKKFSTIALLIVLFAVLVSQAASAAGYSAGKYTCKSWICKGYGTDGAYSGYVFNGTVMRIGSFRTSIVTTWYGRRYWSTQGLSQFATFTGRWYNMSDFEVTQ